MNRPFTFINSAISVDGKISTIERKQIKISGTIDFDRVDELRANSDAIMVGIGTMLADNPSLTVKSKNRRDARKQKGYHENPIRIVVDSKARTPINADIFKKGEGEKIIAVSKLAPIEKINLLKEKATVIVAGETQVNLIKLIEQLKSMGVNQLMVEGGAGLNFAMLSQGLVDEIYTFIGNIIIGGSLSPSLSDGAGFLEQEILNLKLKSFNQMDDGILIEWIVENKHHEHS